MSALSIISSWKKNSFKPVYWLEGEEEFFIDEVINYAEKQILSESDASFNLSVFYGKDANWAEIINACRRYPMFAERQVVLLKEAQQMRDIEKLEAYIDKPLESTIFIVSYKGKALDKRSKLAKTVKKNCEVFLSKKIYENQLPAWANGYIQSKGFEIAPKALSLLVSHIGNDLSRIANEIEKLSLNIVQGEIISVEDIEKFIGVSKKYNVYELQHAFSVKDEAKALRIIQFFEGNPTAVNYVTILPTLYSYFTKILTIHQMKDRSDYALRPLFFNNPIAVQEALIAFKNYSFEEIEHAILLFHEYNLKSIGINSYGASFPSLMKEITCKIIRP